MIPIDDIRRAAERIGPYIHRTPLLSSHLLGEKARVQLHLKCENLQKTGSFKPRGALNKVLSLTDEEKRHGLITVSAGNHAQAVAWAAQQIQSPCSVVMPCDAPKSKIAAVQDYGAQVILHDDRATLFDRLNEEREKLGATFVHPFDDPVVLAGAATVGLEIVEQLSQVEAVFIPVGGGGLMGGITSAIKSLRPQARIVAVELAAGPGLQPALDAGKPLSVPRPKTLADGMTPPFVGQLPLAIAREGVDNVVGVEESELLDSMELLLTRCKLCTEASGAAATAAVLHRKVELASGSQVVSVISGGNIDLETIIQHLSPAEGSPSCES